MNSAKFDYYVPGTIEEASRLLLDIGEGAFLLAGGTDFLLKVNQGMIQPKAVISLNTVKGLDYIKFQKKKGLTIGAGAILADVEAHPQIKRHYPAIAYAASVTANTQIRNMGTVAGNICNAAPSAENVPTLMAMNAEMVVYGKNGERRVSLEDFFKGPGLTVLDTGEILTSIFVPFPPAHSGASYQHLSARSKVDISAVCVGAMVVLKGTGCEDIRIALGAVAPIPMRALMAEKIVKGQKTSQDLIEKAALQASRESKPISDVRASAGYRKTMVQVLTKRALNEALTRAKKVRR